MEPAPNETPAPSPQCPDCRVEMEPGWLADCNQYQIMEEIWHQDFPEKGWLGGITLASFSHGVSTTTWRCPQCFLLRQYAIPKQWRKVD